MSRSRLMAMIEVVPLREVKEAAESDYLRRVFRVCRGDRQLMAKLLEINLSTVYVKLKKYGIE
jgi:DNA-binding NtrC family response regulator